jgi:RNA polymerase sigma-70 factor (ECF subfamily)
MALPIAELLLGAYTSDDEGRERAIVRVSSRVGTSLASRASADAADAALVARLRVGDGDAYEDAIRTYYTWLHGVAMSYVPSAIVAEEIVDGAFARLWERHALLNETTKLAVYLFVLVRNASLDRVKHESVARRQLEQMPALDAPPGMGKAPALPDHNIEQDNVAAAIWRAIESLPERARAIMVLRWREQHDWDEIAEALGLTSAAVQMQHSRALKQLRERLPGYLREG